MKKQRNTIPFWALAGTTFVLAGFVVLAARGPVEQWRSKQVDVLLKQAASATAPAEREEFLAQANIIGWGSKQAPQALADYYVSIGRYDKALPVLSAWPLSPNYTQLGEYALLSQQYTSAQKFYAKAIAQKSTAASYVGIAAAQFNRGDVSNGCANAAKATKLDLGSQPAQDIAATCLLLNPGHGKLNAQIYPVLNSPQLKTDRGKGMFLVANKIYVQGEGLLAKSPATPADWLTLAQLASLRGNYKLAIERAERGIKLDSSNLELNRLLRDSYRALGQPKAELYERRLKLIPLDS